MHVKSFTHGINCGIYFCVCISEFEKLWDVVSMFIRLQSCFLNSVVSCMGVLACMHLI
jgi:hypothetical protein